jgi:hypothetical protein
MNIKFGAGWRRIDGTPLTFSYTTYLTTLITKHTVNLQSRSVGDGQYATNCRNVDTNEGIRTILALAWRRLRKNSDKSQLG